MSNGGGIRGLVWIVAALLIATPGALSAEAQQATPQAEAEDLFNHGRDLLRGGQLQADRTTRLTPFRSRPNTSWTSRLPSACSSPASSMRLKRGFNGV